MSCAKKCANVQTQRDAQSHIHADTRTAQRTVGQPSSLKDLAGAVLCRTTPCTMAAHCAQTPCTSSVMNRRPGEVGHPAIDEDLKRLIQAAADYWHYNEDDLRLIHATAASDPDGLRLALSLDPLKPYYDLDSLPDGVGNTGRFTIQPER